MDKSLYEVTKDEYTGVVKTMKPEYRDVKTEETPHSIKYSIYSKLTNKLICEREAYEDKMPRYYVYSLPTKEESLPSIPTTKVTLKTKEQVQAFFDYFTKMRKEKNNDN